MSRKHFLAFAIGCALAAPAFAGEPINAHTAIAPDGKLDVKNVRGTVHVSAWDRNEIEVTGSIGEGSKFFLDGGGAAVNVRVESNADKGWFNWGGNGPREDTTLEIKAPRGVSPVVHVVSADVTINGLDGGREIDVDSVSGDIKLDAKTQRLELQTVSGDIRVEGASTRANFETVSGDVIASGLSGEVAVESVSGDARLEAGGAVRDFKGHAVSGDIGLTTTLAAHARVRVECMSGDVKLHLPSDLSAAIEAKTFSGSIHSDFGKVDKEEFGSGSKLHATAGSGDAQVEVETFSGDVEIRRQ